MLILSAVSLLHAMRSDFGGQVEQDIFKKGTTETLLPVLCRRNKAPKLRRFHCRGA